MLCMGAALASCASFRDAAGARYRNPVIDADFPDPAVLRAPDGWFYAYATQSERDGRFLNIQVARSRDLVRWEPLGDALPEKPRWAAAKQSFWAPDVIHDPERKRYFMYYSAEPDGAEGKCLAVATAAAAAGPFTDSGSPLICGDGIEHIDPMAFDDPQTGRRLLYWGSGSRPIKVRELTRERLAFAPGSAAVELVFPEPGANYRSLIEGAWVIFRGGAYYLFYSGDRCCTREPSYALMVARSNSAFGPFEELGAAGGSGSSVILSRNGFWLAPGHNSVVADDAGHDWIVYHAVDAARAYFEDRVEGRRSPRVMLLDRIVYRDGWPRIAGDGPSQAPQPAPAVRP